MCDVKEVGKVIFNFSFDGTIGTGYVKFCMVIGHFHTYRNFVIFGLHKQQCETACLCIVN